MATFLQPSAVLNLNAGGPYLTRRSGGPRHALSIGEAVTLNLLAHCGDVAVTRRLAGRVLGSSGSAWTRRILERYATYFGAGAPMDLKADWLSGLDLNAVSQPPRRQAAPAAITWLVTLACNRKCPYCFYKVTPHQAESDHSPSDCSFSIEKAFAMFEEMADIGVADLYLTGGEPLLRRDLVQIIGRASSRQVRSHLVTKFPVDEGMAAALADAGLHDLTFSLDDARANVAAALAGANGYLQEATKAIVALIGAGIPIKVNAVVSSLNQDELERLTQLMIELEVPELSLAAYIAPHPARSNSLRLAVPTGIFERHAREVQAKYTDYIHVDVNGSSIPAESSARRCGRHTDCDVGIDALDVLPDGRVTRCRYLPHEAGLVIGDLKSQSIMDVWNGESLGRFQNPDRQAYAGTSCHDCHGFDSCNSRGRCYFSALTKEKKLHAPDVFCNRK